MNSPRFYLRNTAWLGVAGVLVACMPEDAPKRTAKPSEPPAVEPSELEPESPAGPREEPVAELPTHTGLISIQDVSIANQPTAGHGLTINALFTPWVAADYEERPDELGGCRVWSYDLSVAPAPPEQDQGTLEIGGIRNGDLRCVFEDGRGYVCPSASGQAELVSSAGTAGRATYASATPLFEPRFAGHYLRVEGASTVANNGAFPILGVTSATELLLANPRASDERFMARYSLLAGAGPIPGGGFSPFQTDRAVEVSLRSGGEGSFEFAPVSLTPGAAFSLGSAA
ncbi:MAG TPA: hypothetical protein VFZ61_09740, partial [Polyangiales bacterium]